MNDLSLMRARADVLFTYDQRGRMLYRNDPGKQPAPRLFLGYTSTGYLIRFGQDISDEAAIRLQEIVDVEPPVEDMRSLPPVVAAVGNLLEKQASDREGGPAFRFSEPLPATRDAIQITGANVTLARDTFPWLLTELAGWWPCFAVVRDNVAVSVCFSARIGAVVCEAGVETLPAFRGRGYAAAVTAAWAGAIRYSGRIPLYSTSWHNVASQRVAHQLGLIMLGADVVWL